MAVRPKTATWLSRCLLSVALLFGIVLMHALGHPAGHVTTDSRASYAEHVTTDSRASYAEHVTTDSRASYAEHVTTGSRASRAGHVMAAAPAEHRAAAPAPHSTHPAPAHGAGAAAVCLAVLGVGIGVALLARALGRRTSGRDLPPPTARLAYALRAIPPPAPPGSLLTRLSLSRI
ncbi:hypothetical protein [Streptomyces sp. NPDC005828]|uniref:hypothetical protein n=1 Tax=Streptomyces sp. NPDC005828 TaxID=3157071 RepID=UPI0033D88F26